MTVDKESAQKPTDLRALAVHERLQNQLKSVRQAAEWGMGTLQATCKRLTLPLGINPRERARLMNISIRFLNYRTANVGLNQIRTVFGNIDELEMHDNPYGAIPK